MQIHQKLCNIVYIHNSPLICKWKEERVKQVYMQHQNEDVILTSL